MSHLKQFLYKIHYHRTGAMLTSAILIAAANASALAAETLPGINVGYDVQDFVDNVVCVVAGWMFWILVALTVVFVILAAYKYLISAGEPQKVSEATKTITFAAVAIVVALLAKGFPLLVTSIVDPNGLGNNVCP